MCADKIPIHIKTKQNKQPKKKSKETQTKFQIFPLNDDLRLEGVWLNDGEFA